MTQRIKYLRSAIAVALCIIMSIALNSCNDDDDEPKSDNAIVGEWIKSNGNIYYQFMTDGTGRYICLPDEPGYNPEYPDAAIKHPVDPYYFDYTLDGNILTMKEYYNKDKTDFSIYVHEITVNNDVLQMRELRWSDDGINWYEEPASSWETYNRYISK